MRIAALDLGSNSFHLLVAEVRPDGSFEALARDKEMLRLGSVVASSGSVGEVSTEAAVEAIRRFVVHAGSLGADQTVAYATAAIREAADSASVVDRIRAETGVRVRVISGREEARLIFDAVRASVAFDPVPALVADLGGGSLELMVGYQDRLAWSTSLKLGVGRLTEELVRNDPPSAGDRRRLVHAVTTGLARSLPEINSRVPQMAVGSSGTLTTLVRLAAGNPDRVNQVSVPAAALDALARELMTMTSEQRAELPGVDARRADLLPAGAVVATTLLELTGISALTGSDWALREGMVLDALSQHLPLVAPGGERDLRRQSVLSLCRRCNWAEAHATKVSRLALRLFDGTAALHGLGPAERELLDYGGLLHDIGDHVNSDGHERHTGYLIEHGQLRGFTPDEVAVLACLGRFHRRGAPKTSFDPFGSMAASARHQVTQLVALLQVADGLDRSHGGPVSTIEVFLPEPGRVEVVVEASDDIDLEIWGLRRKRELFERVFDVHLEIVDAQLQLPFG